MSRTPQPGTWHADPSHFRPSRRDVLRVGWLSALGLSLGDFFRLQAGARACGVTEPKANSVIHIYLQGGFAHMDSFDPKPDAPTEYRGILDAIETKLPGVRFSSHMAKTAEVADKLTIVRSMTHTDVAHLSSVHHLMTGRLAPKPNSDADPPSRNDTPHVGAMLDHLHPLPPGVPGFVSLPWTVSHPAAPGGVAPGQHAGWLGAGFDPFLVSGDPNSPSFKLAGLGEQSARGDGRAALRAESVWRESGEDVAALVAGLAFGDVRAKRDAGGCELSHCGNMIQEI